MCRSATESANVIAALPSEAPLAAVLHSLRSQCVRSGSRHDVKIRYRWSKIEPLVGVPVFRSEQPADAVRWLAGKRVDLLGWGAGRRFPLFSSMSSARATN